MHIDSSARADPHVSSSPAGAPRAASEGRAPRVASLLPSATEIVCALGLEDALVGVSHECDWPPSVRGLPVLTSTRVAHAGTSAAIDRDVRRVLEDALAVYSINLDALHRAAPDVIVTQDLCDVCAVSLEDVRKAAAAVLPEARIVNLRPTRLAHIWNDVISVGRAVRCEARAESLVRELAQRVERVQARAASQTERPFVLTIEWIDPVMIGGTWMPELVELAGGRALVTRPGDHAPTLALEALRELDPAPDVVLVKPCGFRLERTLAERDRLRALFAELDWPAVSSRRVWIADGNAYFNRPGPRIVESLEILAGCVHPSEFADLVRTHAAACVRFDRI
jgi:iron complex transport system substrate-binding protein